MIIRKPNIQNQDSTNAICDTLIVCLGNPGYNWTRHNIAADLMLNLLDSDFVLAKKEITKNLFLVFFRGFCSFVLISPDLMNISGGKTFQTFKKLNCRNLIVCCDDLDVKFGQIKKSFKVSSGGHNGTRSIIDSFGHNQFWKVKVGIGRPEDILNLGFNMDVKTFVLKKFTSEEIEKIKENRSIFFQMIQECKISKELEKSKNSGGA